MKPINLVFDTVQWDQIMQVLYPSFVSDQVMFDLWLMSYAPIPFRGGVI